MSASTLNALSPLDGRYADKLALLRPLLSEAAFMRHRVQVELAWLLALSDALVEIKSVCACGRKATMNARIGADGRAASEGAQTEIGGNDRYVALCRRHFAEALEGELVLATTGAAA